MAMMTDLQTSGEVTWEDRLRRGTSRGRLTLNPEYQELKFRLHRRLLDKINLEALASIENEKVRLEVRNALMSLMDEESTLLSSLERQQICDEVLDEVFGLGPLEPLLQDPTISDILVNTHRQVYIERKGQLELTSVTFKDDNHLYRIIDKIVSQVGRRIDESSPMVDARLSDGSRVNAVIPPLAVDGPLMSIRRFGTDKLMPDDLVAKKSITQGMMDVLKGAVTSRLNVIVSGGTGSGKTTMLNALSAYISPTERVVTIEDAAELQLKQPHVVRLETRPPNIEGEGAIRQRELLINASPYAARPYRHRGVSWRGSIGYVAGNEHRSRWIDDHGSRQHAARRYHATRSHDQLGERKLAGDRHPQSDCVRRRFDSASRAAQRRNTSLSQPDRGHHDGRRHGHAARFVCVRKTRRFFGRTSLGTLRRDRDSPAVLREASRGGRTAAERYLRRDRRDRRIGGT